MTATDKSLFDLTAADLMTPVVVTLHESTPLREAAEELFRAGVHGAPVANAVGACVGVLSVTDLARWAARPTGPGESTETSGDIRSTEDPCVFAEWQMVEVERLPTDDVRHYMTEGPVTVEPSAPITELARTMVGACVHRLVVADADGRPVGVVSAADLIAALAGSGDYDRDTEPSPPELNARAPQIRLTQ
jgi:CBS domain-containing protein